MMLHSWSLSNILVQSIFFLRRKEGEKFGIGMYNVFICGVIIVEIKNGVTFRNIELLFDIIVDELKSRF